MLQMGMGLNMGGMQMGNDSEMQGMDMKGMDMQDMPGMKDTAPRGESPQ